MRGSLLLALGIATSLVASCSLLVPEDVPEFHCAGSDPSACPAGMVCDETTRSCVVTHAILDAGDDAEQEDPPTPDADAADGAGEPSSIGGPCVDDRDCKEDLLCGTRTILTNAIIASDESALCTRPCCTSADCPSGFVCFGAGTGGNYCVPAPAAQRGETGENAPGEACEGDDDCRSGLCAGDRCVDTCCANEDCASGTTCRVKIVSAPPPSRYTWACAPAESDDATIADGASCSNAALSCRNDNCSGFPLKCRPSCCNSAACATLDPSFVCAYGRFIETNSDAKWCFSPPPGDAGARAASGERCSGNLDCISQLCDLETRTCAEACCMDDDCPDGLVCRPSPVGAPLLRCTATR